MEYFNGWMVFVGVGRERRWCEIKKTPKISPLLHVFISSFSGISLEKYSKDFHDLTNIFVNAIELELTTDENTGMCEAWWY